MHLLGGDADARVYALLTESLETDPSLVNTYAVLAELIARRDTDVYAELLRVWDEHGDSDQYALRFIEEYSDGDPAAQLADWCARHTRGPALLVRVGDDVEFVDLYDYSGDPRQTPVFVGRVRDPRLICSPRDFVGLPAAKQAIAEDLVKRSTPRGR